MELLKEVQAAMGTLMTIHNEEVAALLMEDFDEVERLRETLQSARTHKASVVSNK